MTQRERVTAANYETSQDDAKFRSATRAAKYEAKQRDAGHETVTLWNHKGWAFTVCIVG